MLNYAVWKRIFIDGESVPSILAELEQPLADEEIPEDSVLAAGN